MTSAQSKITATDIGTGYKVILRDLSFTPSRFRSRPVLDHISVTIDPGEFVAVVGENSAGKSSFLAAIAGELPQVVGEITVAGQPVNKPINQVIDGVGVVHQFDEIDLIPHLSVAQNIAIRQMFGGGHTSKLFATNPEWKRSVAATLGSKASLCAENLDELVSNLAGGKRQMLSVAIAMHLEHIKNPCRLVLLDEHTSRLDHKNSKMVMEYTATSIKKANCTAIMVTHRYSDALAHAGRILVIRDGRIEADRKDVKSLNLQELTSLVEGTC